jgi:carbohydrate-selective porin OprB
MEVYYSFYINEHIAISPDLQVVHNLTGANKANTVTIFGLRLHCKF